MSRHFLSPTLGIIALALAVRVMLLLAISQPVVSDGMAYWTMATTALSSGPMHDTFGQIAFYSAGYPLLLAAVFWVFGPSLGVTFMLNLLLAAGSTWLVMAIARWVRDDPLFIALAGIGYAILIPAAFAVGLVQKENLSTPLLLLVVLAALKLTGSERRLLWAAIAGIAFGASLLTGMASVPLGLVIAAGLFTIGWRAAMRSGLIVAIAAAASLAPWLVHTDAALGSPVITTNGGFNLYLGNNPAATGRFMSIADTPVGPSWEGMRASLGEKGATDALAALAIDHARNHPIQTARLGLTKLGLFWAPNIPDAADGSGIVYAARWVEVGQFVLLGLLGLIAVARYRRTDPRLWWLVGAITAYWLMHAAVYIIPHYRDPVMPLVVILAALPVATLLRARLTRLTLAHP